MTAIKFIDIPTCGYTLGQMMAEIRRLQAEHPDMEFWMSGTHYAIMGEVRP